ncbi:DMT family transporter [Streptomyces sp. 3N207]|uniref:DMT family transporter n=1 Tax=Streptomyces sp. 3N207 TaxID=3457417 RepID=UPI003FCFB1A4
MTVTVLAISATAPLTAAASAPPLAMAFWRNCLGFATLGPFLLLLRRREVVRLANGERSLLRREQWRPMIFGFLAATALALHFAAFMTSTRMTSVAMSTALVATQPVWQALIARGQGVRAARKTWTGLTLAVVGAGTAAGLDVQAGGTALLGDLLALLGAIAQAAYTALSEKARPSVSTPLYSTVTSLVCGVELLAICWLADIPLTGLDQTTQLSLLGLLVLPQLLGLGSMNFALGRTSATTMSVLLLLETPVAALTAWWLLGQSVEAATVPGLLMIIIGVTIVIKSGGEQAAPQQGKHHAGVPPYPDYAPDTLQLQQLVPDSTARTPEHKTPARAFETAWTTSPRPRPLRHAAVRDPRVDWARHTGDESPTVQLSLHGAGAFSTMYVRRPHVVDEEPASTVHLTQ